MPIAAGEHKTGDVVDVYAIAANQALRLQTEGMPTEVQGFESQPTTSPYDTTPTAGEVNQLVTRDWITASVGRWLANVGNEDDPNFVQPWAELDPKYYPYKELFEDADSYNQWYTAQTIADQDMYDKQMFDRMDIKDWTHYIAGQFVDPISLVLAVGTAGLYGVKAGGTVASAAARTAGLTAAEMTALEGILQVTDPLREVDESIISILAGGAFGALMGSGGQALANRFSKSNELKGEIFQVLKDEVDIQRANNAIPDGETPTYTAKDEKPTFNPLRYVIDNPIMRNAQIRMQYSGSPTLSRLADKLGANNIIKQGDYNGTRYNGQTLNETIKKATRRSFKQISDEGFEVKRVLKNRGVKLSLDDIMFRATRAARRGGAGDEYDEINRMGARFREEMESWAQRGIAQKVLTKETVKAMDNYVPRIYDTDAILRRWDLWEATITSHFRAKNPDMPESQIQKIPTQIYNRINKIKLEELTLTQSKKRAGGMRAVPKSGQFKARQLDDIDEALLEPFLVNDMRALSNRYVLGAGSDIMMREQFGADNIMEVGGVPVPKADYEKGMQELVEQFGEAKTARQRKKKDKAIENMEKAITNYMRNILHRPVETRTPGFDKFVKGVRGYAAAAQLGEVAVSAMPDASNNILQYGLTNMFASMPTFFRTLPQVFKQAGAKGYAAQHWRDMDVALDNLLSSNIMAIAEIEDASQYGIKRGAFHGTEVARKAFRLFLADKWNTGAKLLAATAAERAILRDAQKMVKGTLGKQRAAKMHRIGMTKNVAKRFVRNLDEHGKRNGLAKVELWDENSSGDLARMIFRESEMQVVAPDSGEIPTWLDNEVGRLVLQFRTFTLAHTMKQLIPAAQRLSMGDMQVLAGVASMASFGILSQFIKDVVRNKFDYEAAVDTWSDYTAADIAAIGLDKGAVVSYIGEAVGSLDNKLNGKLGE
jgi:hypothetical protein